MTPRDSGGAGGGLDYTRAYLNGRLLRLYRVLNRKTARDGRPMTMRGWELGVGRFAILVGAWEPTEPTREET